MLLKLPRGPGTAWLWVFKRWHRPPSHMTEDSALSLSGLHTAAPVSPQLLTKHPQRLGVPGTRR